MKKFRWLFLIIGIFILVIGCQSGTMKKQASTHKRASELQAGFPQSIAKDQMSSTKSKLFTKNKKVQEGNIQPPRIEQDSKWQKIAKKHYVDSLPGPIPEKSINFMLTIDLGYAQKWDIDKEKMAFWKVGENSPKVIKNGEKQSGLLIYKPIPSASSQHLEIFSIGPKPDYGANDGMAIYTNKSLYSHHQVEFTMGTAMIGGHFITDLKGNRLKDGKEFLPVTGYWTRIETGKWYYMMDECIGCYSDRKNLRKSIRLLSSKSPL